MEYLQNGTIPKEDKIERAFRTMTSRFIIIQCKLYKKNVAGPYLRCLEDHEVAKVLKEIHKGDCGNHTRGRSLCSKALRTIYYWVTMKKDSFLHVQKCDACQRHSNILHQPTEPLHLIISPWPFMKWGMDIVGKLPVAP